GRDAAVHWGWVRSEGWGGMGSATQKSPSTGTLPPSPRLDSVEAIAAHIEALVGLDPRLGPVRDFAGTVPPRVNQRGFAGIAEVICGQQVSVASASAIWGRFELLP